MKLQEIENAEELYDIRKIKIYKEIITLEKRIYSKKR